MERRLAQARALMDKPPGGLRATSLGKIFGPVLCRKCNLVIRVLAWSCF